MWEITENFEAYRNPVQVQDEVQAKMSKCQLANKENYDKRHNKNVSSRAAI